MAMKPSEVRAKFPADPLEFNGVDLSKMKPIHKAINRELISTGMNYRKIAEKYSYSIDSMYKLARTPKSKAYREWLGDMDRTSQIADAQEVLKHLTEVIREEAYDEHVTPGGAIVIKKNDTKDRLKGLEILTKVYGMQKDVQETKQTVIVVDTDELDTIEVEPSEGPEEDTI